jgi:hypothetical protein
MGIDGELVDARLGSIDWFVKVSSAPPHTPRCATALLHSLRPKPDREGRSSFSFAPMKPSDPSSFLVFSDRNEILGEREFVPS